MSDWKTEYERRVRAVVQKRIGSFGTVDPDAEVHITESFSEGYACCGGRDPDCYCSFVEPASHEVIVAAGQYSTTYYSDKYGPSATVSFLNDLMEVE